MVREGDGGRVVRDACFNNWGDKFVSDAYDRYIKLWDTETGKLMDDNIF